MVHCNSTINPQVLRNTDVSNFRWDHVTIHEGAVGPGAGPLCGYVPPPSYESIGDKVRIEFVSDETFEVEGFQISYTCKQPPPPVQVQCGGKLEGNSGTVTTPEWPENYPNNAKCLWRKRCPRKKKLEMKFSSFDVEFEDNCK